MNFLKKIQISAFSQLKKNHCKNKSMPCLYIIFVFLIVLGVSSYSFSEDTPSLFGWIWSGGATENAGLGWVKLSGTTTIGTNYGVNIDWNSDSNNPISGITGCAWIGDADPLQIGLDGKTCSQNSTNCFSTGWLCFDYNLATATGTPNQLPPDGVIYTIPPVTGKEYIAILDRTNATSTISGWARFLSMKNENPPNDRGWVHLRNSTPISYGVDINTETRRLSGYAWSDDIGWIWFNPEAASSTPAIYRAAWLQTSKGNIHSENNIGKSTSTSFAPPNGKFNTTYLITQTGQLVNFTSEKKKTESAKPWTTTTITTKLGFPKKEKNYKNKLGEIDIKGLTTIVNTNGNKNKYGNEVINLETGETKKPINSFNKNNAVYYKNGDFEITSGKFGPNPKGGKTTIIIKGNLTISGDITYETQTTLEFLRNLNSLGIFVIDDDGTKTIQEGNITIDSSVKNIVGNFYAEGEISTGTSSTKSLTCEGSMIAHKFNFQRSYIGSGEDPSENITYDGRIFANPPPGFQDIVKALPAWKE